MLADALTRLYALAPRGARLGLDAMRAACAAEGDPQDAYASLHVAGTNGKGSVCANLEAIARASGRRAGLYTSPHLQRFGERIRVDGAPLDDDALARVLVHVLDRHPALTFFEVATLAAFMVFRDAGVEVAVVEVGLGGRLDATNVLARPRATAVTTIALDHVAILGGTLAAIAAEKAGIAKRAVPLVVGRLPDEARAVVEAHARDVGAAPCVRLGAELACARRVDGELDVAATIGGRRRSVVARPTLGGVHQQDNTAVAVGVAWASGLFDDDAAIARGVETMVRWPGRLEELRAEDGAYLLDGAHNDEGARALAAALDARGERAERRALVFGAMGDKPWSEMLVHLRPRVGARVFVAPRAHGGGRSAVDPAAMAADDSGARVASSFEEARALARAAVGEDGVVVVAGSLYLVGEARAALRGEPSDPHVGL